MEEKIIFEKLIENHERNLRRLTRLSKPNLEKLNEELNFLENEYGKSFEKYKLENREFNFRLNKEINKSRKILIEFINTRIRKIEKENDILKHNNVSMEKECIKKRMREIPKFNNENIGDGQRGENNVNFQLRFLPYEYIVVKSDCKNKYRNDCILIKDEKLVDAYQEFDHLIIGPQGVFNIETKAYKGQIVIDKNGKWYTKRINSEEVESLESPVGQVYRHSNILKSFLENIPVIDIICMANKELIMVGENNSPIKILKTDMLLDYIQNYKNDRNFNEEEIEAVATLIDKHKINRITM